MRARVYRGLALIAFLALAAILFLPAFAAAIDFDPKQAAGVDARVSIAWNVVFSGPLPSSAELTTYAFALTPFQSVDFDSSRDCSHPCSLSTDAFGNRVVKFAWAPASSAETLRFAVRVRTNVQAFTPSGLPSPDARYTQPSQYAAFFSEARSTAQNVVAGAQSEEEKLARLTEWVHNYVTYEGVGYRDVLLTSTEVYAGRTGKCSEFSHLLIALLRELGIPAKFVAGFVFTGTEWGAHAWVEAYANGRWYPLDPTYGEALDVDGTHLKFAEGVDQADVKEVVRTQGFGVQSGSVTFARDASVQLFGRTDYRGLYALSVAVPTGTVAAGSAETIAATLASRAPRLLGVPLSLNVPPSLGVVGDKARVVVLSPGESKTVSWTVLVPDDLERNYIYNYSAIVGGLGEAVHASFLAQANGEARKLASVSLARVAYELSPSTVRITVEFRNDGNLPASLSGTLSLEGQAQPFAIGVGAGEMRSVSADFPRPAADAMGEVVVRLGAEETRFPYVVRLATPTFTPTPDPANGLGLPSVSLPPAAAVVPPEVAARLTPDNLFLAAALAAALLLGILTARLLARRP